MLRDIVETEIGTRNIGYFGEGYGNQISVSDYSQIKSFVEEHIGIDNIGISISAYKNGVPLLLFLPFDFDSSNLKDAWEDAKKLFNHLIACNYGAYLIYSGRKGFHVLIQTHPRLYTRKQLRMIQKMFKGMLNLKTLDEQIFGDISRLMRVPYTYNINGGLCQILAMNDGEEMDLNNIYSDDYFPIEIYKNGNNGRTFQPEYHDYSCIEVLVRNDPEPRHLIRFTYTILRLAEGYTYNEILDEMESFEWKDFNEDYSRKQIEHIDGRNYVPPSCKTLKELGYCIVEECPNSIPIETLIKEVGIK